MNTINNRKLSMSRARPSTRWSRLFVLFASAERRAASSLRREMMWIGLLSYGPVAESNFSTESERIREKIREREKERRAIGTGPVAETLLIQHKVTPFPVLDKLSLLCQIPALDNAVAADGGVHFCVLIHSPKVDVKPLRANRSEGEREREREDEGGRTTEYPSGPRWSCHRW
jgi:hypothetical protein